MANFAPPPTWAPIVIEDPGHPERATFNPVWLDWLVKLVANTGPTGSGSGTVTSVSVTAPSEFTATGNPITSSGAISINKNNQNANLVYAGPVSGGAAVPTFRSLALADIPTSSSGIWTPADNSGATLAFTSVSANYTKLGNMVFAYVTLTYPANASGASASISGLPVASANANYAQVPAIVDTSASITGGLVLVPVKNTTTANFDVGTPFGPATNLQLSGASVATMLIYPAS